MGRPKYQITESDFQTAKGYLVRQGYSRTPGRGVERIADPGSLQTWCDDYLRPEQWKRLRSTILQERKRGNDEAYHKKQSNITISRRTLTELHKIQKELAHKHKVTLDQIIRAMAVQYSHKSAAQILRELEMQDEFEL